MSAGESAPPGPLFHLADPTDWAAVDSGDGFYEPAAFQREGFIHLSSAEQLVATFGRYYSDRTDLVLLTIDELHPSVAPKLVWESLVGGPQFPHLYARLDRTAVTLVQPNWVPAADE
jgi:uncharacterized protein (DUF952 family)